MATKQAECARLDEWAPQFAHQDFFVFDVGDTLYATAINDQWVLASDFGEPGGAALATHYATAPAPLRQQLSQLRMKGVPVLPHVNVSLKLDSEDMWRHLLRRHAKRPAVTALYIVHDATGQCHHFRPPLPRVVCAMVSSLVWTLRATGTYDAELRTNSPQHPRVACSAVHVQKWRLRPGCSVRICGPVIVPVRPDAPSRPDARRPDALPRGAVVIEGQLVAAQRERAANELRLCLCRLVGRDVPYPAVRKSKLVTLGAVLTRLFKSKPKRRFRCAAPPTSALMASLRGLDVPNRVDLMHASGLFQGVSKMGLSLVARLEGCIEYGRLCELVPAKAGTVYWALQAFDAWVKRHQVELWDTVDDVAPLSEQAPCGSGVLCTPDKMQTKQGGLARGSAPIRVPMIAPAMKAIWRGWNHP